MSLEFAFPPVSVDGSLEHVICWAADAAEFLASAQAWLLLHDLAATANGPTESIWAAVQAEHTRCLGLVDDMAWRTQLVERLEATLFEVPRYRTYWEQFEKSGSFARTHH